MILRTLIVFFVLSFFPVGAWAKNGETCPALPATEKQAKRMAGHWFTTGDKAIKKERYKKALKSFLCSLKMVAHENTFFNISQLVDLMKSKKTAHRLLSQFLEDNPDHALSEDIKELISSIERSENITEPFVEPVVEPVVVPVIEPEKTPDILNLKIPAFFLFGTSAAILAGSIVLHVNTLSAQTSAEDAVSHDAFTDRDEAMKHLQMAVIFGYSATGLVAVTGIYLLWLNRKQKSSEKRRLKLSITPGGPSGILINGWF